MDELVITPHIYSNRMKFTKPFSTFLLLFFLSGNLIAQNVEPCHTSYHHAERIKSDPDILQQRQALEANIQDILKDDPNYRVSGGIVTIPVVVHILHSNPSENISTAQIMSQFDVLNRDFRRQNADTSTTPAVWASTMADAEIEFCLATIDPNGNPSTGITRTLTTVTTFQNDEMKFDSTGGIDAWPREDYLNVWVCDMPGLTAFAQFPGFAAETDGVAIDYRRFGTIGNVSESGRLMVHEAGHWLHLFHVWGNDNFTQCASDSVADTPPQDGSSPYNCPSFPQYDNCTSSGSGIMFMNYMDYTEDVCLNSFTNGQVARMHAALTSLRPTILNSTKCSPLNLPPVDASIAFINGPTGTFCDLDITPEFSLGNFGSDSLTSVTINYQLDAGTVQTINWTGGLASLNSVTLTLPTITPLAGTHTLDIWTSNPNGGIDGLPSNDLKSTTFTNSYPPIGSSTPIVEDFEFSFFPPMGWYNEFPLNFFTWDRIAGVSGYGVGNGCIWVNNYNNIFGNQIDILNLPVVDLSSLPVAQMSFDIAYQAYDTLSGSDTLKVQVSTNCGRTWDNIYVGTGVQMATTTPTYSTAAFTPTASEWRTEVFDLSPYANSNSVMIRFRSHNYYENNLYIDNVNIGVLVAKDEPLEGQVKLYPNPTHGKINVSLPTNLPSITSICIFNAWTGMVDNFQPSWSSSEIMTLDVSNLSTGLYFLEIQTAEGKIVKKFIVE